MIRVVTDLTKFELDIRAIINVFYYVTNYNKSTLEILYFSQLSWLTDVSMYHKFNMRYKQIFRAADS